MSSGISVALDRWRAVFGFLPLLAVLFIGGCGSQGAGEAALRFGIASAPITLDPRYATDATSARLNRLLYRRLVDFNENSRPVPALAQWKKISTTHYRFNLGDRGRTFHDGSRLQAADVKATYDYVLDPDNASPHRTSLNMVERIEVVDEDTVDFHLERADPLFPGYLVIGIVPKKAIENGRRLENSPMGSGPFRFRSWPNEGLLRLVRIRDDQLFEFIHVADSTVRVLKLMRGEIDMLQNNLPTELVRYLERQEPVDVERARGSNFTYLGFNLRDPDLSNLKVRRAIAHAINRGAITRFVLGGKTRIAAALLPPEHWAGNPELESPDYDPATARRLLHEAGYDRDHPLRLTYKTSSDPFRVRIATILQRQLAEVGIEVLLRSFDWATFYGDIRAGRFQLYSLTWVGIKSPDIFRYVFHSESVPPKGANRGRYNSATADHLIEAAEESTNLKRRTRYYRQLQQHLLDTLPFVPLWYEEHFFAARRDVRGYSIAPDGNYDGLLSVERIGEPVHAGGAGSGGHN